MKFHNMCLYNYYYADNLRAKMERVHDREFAQLHLQLRSDQMKYRYNSSVGDGKSLQKGDRSGMAVLASVEESTFT